MAVTKDQQSAGPQGDGGRGYHPLSDADAGEHLDDGGTAHHPAQVEHVGTHWEWEGVEEGVPSSDAYLMIIRVEFNRARGRWRRMLHDTTALLEFKPHTYPSFSCYNG